MNKEEIDKWLDNEYGVSYTRLEELHDFYFEKYCDLKEENQELKKQLKKCYCNRTDCSGRIKGSKTYDSLEQKIKNQQKEFIEYLENEKDRLIRECSHHYEDSFGRYHVVNENIYDEVDKNLQKYKEILGGKDE